MYRILLTLTAFCFVFTAVQGQDETEREEQSKRALRESKNITYDANQELVKNDFIEAEADYRRAISKSGENTAAPYNLGRAYYNRESYAEAFARFKEAGEKAGEKPTKHKAFHNMGNVFMRVSFRDRGGRPKGGPRGRGRLAVSRLAQASTAPARLCQ